MNWLVIGFWGCAAMWLISLAGDFGLKRNPEVAEGIEWLALISAIIAFIRHVLLRPRHLHVRLVVSPL